MLHSQSIREMVRKIEAPICEPEVVPRVIAISGGKGGVGKTVLTANLGVCLSQLGLHTLLVDGDFGLANLDVLFNIRPETTIDQVLSGERGLKEITISVANHLKMIPAASGITQLLDLDDVHRAILSDQVQSLNEVYDAIIIDTPAGISKNVRYWAEASQEVILVTTPDPTSLSDCYATMKVLSQTSRDYNFKLIVNMVKDEEEALAIYNRLSLVGEEFLGVRVSYLGFMLFDEIVRASVRERVPYIQKYPLSKSSQSIRTIAQSLLKETGGRLFQGGTSQFFWKKMIKRQVKHDNR